MARWQRTRIRVAQPLTPEETALLHTLLRVIDYDTPALTANSNYLMDKSWRSPLVPLNELVLFLGLLGIPSVGERFSPDLAEEGEVLEESFTYTQPLLPELNSSDWCNLIEAAASLSPNYGHPYFQILRARIFATLPEVSDWFTRFRPDTELLHALQQSFPVEEHKYL